ncbi:MAG: amino acid ABC transporter permease [Rhodospirillales bacterium]|nr:amino acid ABC transporter permease [Rhodospirillales bacterium]
MHRLSTRLAIFAAFAALAGCAGGTGGGFTWGWHVVLPTTPQGRTNLGFLVEGFQQTVLLSLATLAVSMVLGLVVALLGMSDWAPFRTIGRAIEPGTGRRVTAPGWRGRLSRWRPLAWINRGYVEMFRSIPILVMLLWVFYGVPTLTGLQLTVFSASLLAIALCDSAFEAEIFRAGIQSIERGQREAAKSLGLQPWQEMRLVVLPQAIRRILPPLANQFIYIVKMSSLASVIGLGELTRKANELNVTVFRPLEIYTFLVLEYLVLILAISAFVRWLERRLGADQSHGRER